MTSTRSGLFLFLLQYGLHPSLLLRVPGDVASSLAPSCPEVISRLFGPESSSLVDLSVGIRI